MRSVATRVVVALVVAGCGGTRRVGTPTVAPGNADRGAGPVPKGEDPGAGATGRPPPAPSGPRTGAIASGDGVSRLSAYGGHLVFSRRAGDRYRLYHWHDGRVDVLPIPSRRTAFDADAGPDEAGQPAVVYSQCSVRCRTFQLRLDRPASPRELGLEGRMPSTWRGRLAYVADGKLWIRLRGKDE